MLDHQSTAQERKEWHATQVALAQAALREFNELYPTNEDCLDFLLQTIRVSRNQCSNCHSREGIGELRWFKCNQCHYQTWYTSPSDENRRFFSHVRKVRYWAFAVYLKMRAIAASAHLFHDLLDCSSSTARNIFKKMELIIVDAMDKENVDLVHACYFKEVITRRSIQTPADSHPNSELMVLEEQTTSNDERSGEDNSHENAIASLSDEERTILECITTTPILDDQIIEKSGLPVGIVSGTLFVLTMKNLITQPFSNRFVLMPKRPVLATRRANAPLAAKTIAFIRNVWRGSSCKMLQLAEAERWRLSDRARWGGEAFRMACATHPPITDAEVRNYVRQTYIMVQADSAAQLPGKAA